MLLLLLYKKMTISDVQAVRGTCTGREKKQHSAMTAKCVCQRGTLFFAVLLFLFGIVCVFYYLCAKYVLTNY